MLRRDDRISQRRCRRRRDSQVSRFRSVYGWITLGLLASSALTAGDTVDVDKAAASAVQPSIHFEDIAETAGVRFTYSTRSFGERYQAQVLEMFTEGGAASVIMGSGDEFRLEFDAGSLPELPGGWRRDFLLFVDGWAKEGDANAAHSQTVGLLPNHDMPQYPYELPYRYPETGEHNLYREHYNVRPALRLIRPLTEGLFR